MTTSDTLRRFLEGQFQAWTLPDSEQTHARPRPVIAITRELGCGAEHIAQALAQDLGLALYDGEMIEEITKDVHVSAHVVATLDEKVRPELDAWLASLYGGPDMTSNQYMKGLRSVLYTISAHGNAIIVGRGANFLIPAEKKTIGLCFVAPLEARVKNIMQEHRLSSTEARERIARIECERRRWVKEMCFADIDDVTNYHLVMNTSLVASETIVQIVKEIVRVKTFRE